MKTIKLKNATLELSDEDITELRKQLEEPKSWPEVGDDYWGWNSFGWMPDSCMWEGDECEKDGLARGEIFRTKEECEEDNKKRRALVRIKDFIRNNNFQFEPDWNNEDQRKYSIYFDHSIKSFDVDGGVRCEFIMPFYFSRKEYGEKIIDACEEDLNILFNIK